MRAGDPLECHSDLQATVRLSSERRHFLVDFLLVAIASFPVGPQRSGGRSG
jgi:hypothetical protein